MDNIDNPEQRSRLPDRAHRTPSRRTVLGGLTAGSLLILHWRGARAAFAVPDVAPRPIRFDIVRAGDVIGTHEVDFALSGGALSATTRIEVEVRVLGVKLFEFRHNGTEVWADGRLQKFDSETLDDDSKFFVVGRATADGFRMTNRKGVEMAPADIMVGSYWTPEIARETLLIDPQRGRLKEQQLVAKDAIRIPVASASVEAIRYTLTGLTDGWVAYDDRGRWIAAELKKKGSDIQYRLRG
jgi:hypothetical protein